MGSNINGFRLSEHGDPSVLKWTSLAKPVAGDHQVVIRHRAVGVNFIDVYYREGLYPMPLPSGLGVEAAGIVESVGQNVKHIQCGDRVAYCMSSPGAYAEMHAVEADKVVVIPDNMDFTTAAGFLLKGLTAAFLLHQLKPMQSGESILVYAAAGGVGQLLCQWAKSLGLRVIGVVSTEEKAAIATRAGADHVIIGEMDQVPARVKSFTGGKGVDVVYDSIGAATWQYSLDSLRQRGWYVTYGNASGPPPAIAPIEIQKRGSLVMTRPSLGDFITPRENLLSLADVLFKAWERGDVKPCIGQVLPLQQAPEAHTRLQARLSTGSIVLNVE